MTKEDIISEYNRVKKLLERQPSSNDFYTHSHVTKRELGKVFGAKAFSKLASLCGDTPNKFSSPKSRMNEILSQYGKLARALNKLPIGAEWDNAGLKPTVNGIERSHNIRWSEIRNLFKEFAQNNSEWHDILVLYPAPQDGGHEVDEITAEECYVYLIVDTKTQLHKIGMSKSPDVRERTLQSEKPSVKLVAKKKFVNRRIAATFEKTLHETYSHKKARGEYFLLDEGDVQELKKTLDD